MNETEAITRVLWEDAGELARKLEAIEKLAAGPALPSEVVPAEAAVELVPRAILSIGTARAQAGKEATVLIRLTTPQPVAGVWLNIRHSPRLEFLNARSKVKSRAFRVEKGDDHFRAVLMFTSDLESESAMPGKGLVELEPETLILEATYRVPADATPGQQYVVQAGRSGGAIPGVARVSWPTLVLNWGLGLSEGGGIEPMVESGSIKVIAE